MLQIGSQKVSDFFTMVDENFGIQPFQMLQIDSQKVSDFFIIVKENFEIHFFQMHQIDWKREWFLHHCWRKFWNSVLPNASNWGISLKK